MNVNATFSSAILATGIAFMLSGCATTSLSDALLDRDYDAARKLIDRVADVNEVDMNEYTGSYPGIYKIKGATPLCYSSAHYKTCDTVGYGKTFNVGLGNYLCQGTLAEQLNIVRLLLKKGAKVNASCGAMISPLHAAASYGNFDIVKLLIENGAEINKTSSSGITPLMSAYSKGNVDVANLLIRNGANVSKVTSLGETAMEFYANYLEQHAQAKAFNDRVDQMVREQRRRDAEAAREFWKGAATLATGVAVGNATRNLNPDQQTRMMSSAMKGVQSGDMSDFSATTQQVKAERTQEHNAKMQAIEAQKEREGYDAKEAEAANNRRMMDASIRSHQPSAQNTTNRQQPPAQPWNNQANRSANSNANSSRNAGNTQIALNQNGVRADSSSDNENWKSAFTPKLSWADCEKRAKELHGRCDRAEIFKPAFTAADRSAAEQSKLCSETKNRALNSNFYAIVEDLGCGCYLHEGNLHCTYFTIGKSRHKSVGGGKSK